MKLNRTTILKAFLAIVPALLLALVLQPAAALAHTVTYETMDTVKFECIYDTYATPPTENAWVTETVEDGGCPTINKGRYQVGVPDSDYEFAFWLAYEGTLGQKDVTLIDDTVLKAGTPLTTEQVQSVVVHDDLTFIAYFGNVWGSDPLLLDVIFTASNGGSIVDPRKQTIRAGVAPDEVIPEPDQGFEFDYWTADVPVYVYTNYSQGYTGGAWVAPGTHIAGSSPCASVCMHTTFTAHFKATTPTYTVTYTVDDKGVAFDENHNTESVAEGNSPASVPEPVAQDSTKYMFAYWSTDAEVVLSDGTVIDAGAKITTDQLKQVKVTSALTFTANFKGIRTVTYKANDDGYIPAGVETTEVVAKGNSPVNVPSPEATDSTNYAFAYWTADQVVTLIDGTTFYIGSSSWISTEQIKQAVITTDTTFTAHFTNKVTVTYEVDANIGFFPPSGTTITEEVGRGGCPANVPTPQTISSDDVVFGGWIPNKGSWFVNGTWFNAGTKLTTADVRNVKLVEDGYTFTAYFRDARHTVTYEVDENGSFPSSAATSEVVADSKAPANVPTPTPKDATTHVYGYWTANVKTTYQDGTTIAAGKKIPIDKLKKLVTTQDLTLTAHLRETTHTVTYLKGDYGHFDGVDSPSTVQVDDLASPTNIPTVVSDTPGYPFGSWKANVDVVLSDGTAITQGNEITTEQVATIVVDEDIELTAYYPKTGYAYFIYTTDGKGGFEGYTETTPSVETLVYDKQYLHDIPTPYAYDATKYAFETWITDTGFIYYLWDYHTFESYEAGDSVSNPSTSQPALYNEAGEKITLTATFEQIAVDLTYQTDGKGMVIDKSTGLPTDNSWTERVALNSSHTAHPSGCEAIPDENYGNYVFDYWTASDWVYVDGEGSYKSGTPLTSDQIKLIDLGRIANVYDLTFTAHFAKLHTITYEAGAHGSVSPTTEQVKEGYAPAGPTIVPDANYAFDYWTANKAVQVADADTQAVMLADSNSDVEAQASTTTIDKGEAISTDEFSRIVTSDDVTFTAHFKRTAPYTVTYTTDGNGSVTPETEEVLEGKSPKGPSITPNANFEFDYWTANTEVYYIDDENNIIEFDVDDQISADELKKLSVEEDVVFTAHFKEAPVDPEPEPVDPDDPDNPDGGDTIKPADGADGKLVPKTGDTLPGVTAAVVLGAGAVVAGAALLKKRCR